jgi:hypothetical protein
LGMASFRMVVRVDRASLNASGFKAKRLSAGSAPGCAV